MNKSDIAHAVAKKVDMSIKDSENVVTQIFKVIEESLAANEKVQLVGFGTFDVKNRAERLGKNPQTKEVIIIPASKNPSFKAGKTLKDAVQA